MMSNDPNMAFFESGIDIYGNNSIYTLNYNN